MVFSPLFFQNREIAIDLSGAQIEHIPDSLFFLFAESGPFGGGAVPVVREGDGFGPAVESKRFSASVGCGNHALSPRGVARHRQHVRGFSR